MHFIIPLTVAVFIRDIFQVSSDCGWTKSFLEADCSAFLEGAETLLAFQGWP